MGVSWTCFGFMVLPRSAFFFDHETESVSEGRKSSITIPNKLGLEACNKLNKGQPPVGMISAFFSLPHC